MDPANAVANDPIGSACACAALRRASRAITQLYNLTLAPTGLKATQFIVLDSIKEAGEVSPSRFASENTIAIETLSRRLAGLRRKGLIEMRRGKDHGKRVYGLTARGKQVLREARPHWERAQSRLRTILGDRDWRFLLRFSQRVVYASQQAEQLRVSNRNRPMQ